METLQNKARELLTNGTVQAIIGYGEGSEGRTRAIFVRQPEGVERLIMDDRCQQNLAVYLHKREVQALGKVALVANPSVLKTILQLARENHFAADQVVLLPVSAGGEVLELEGLPAIEAYLKENAAPPSFEALDEVAGKSREERWEYWTSEFSRCIKCYACRSSCPLCYCSRCLVETNRPQWVPVASHGLGNLEWHINRAMHLAGRCIGCGECARACPVDIPLHLLTQELGREIKTDFGVVAGTSTEADYTLSTFKPVDHESFIG